MGKFETVNEVKSVTAHEVINKIEADGGAPYIKTVYGMGYQWTGGEAK